MKKEIIIGLLAMIALPLLGVTYYPVQVDSTGALVSPTNMSGYRGTNLIVPGATPGQILTVTPGGHVMASNLNISVTATNAIDSQNGKGTNTTLYGPGLFSATLGTDLNGNLKNITNSGYIGLGGDLATGVVIDTESGGGGIGGIQIEYGNKGKIYGEYFTVCIGGSSNDLAAGEAYAIVLGGGNNYLGTTSIGGANYSTIIGGRSNTITGGDYSWAAGFQSKVQNGGVWMWTDFQPGAAPFTSTGTNQFLVRATGGMGINTNNPSTNGLRVAGNVDAGGYTINGTNIADWAGTVTPGNAMLKSFGYGTNTTIYFRRTNIVANPLILIGTNMVVHGTNYYYQDGDTNSPAFVQNPTGNLQYSNGIPYYAVYGPEEVYTNMDGSLQYTITWNWNANINNQTMYCVVTNGGLLASYLNGWPTYESPTPDGLYSAIHGATNPPTGVLNPVSTNYTYQPIILCGQFYPMSAEIPIFELETDYIYPHGLGHRPHMVRWFLKCIHADAALRCEPGDVLPLDVAQQDIYQNKWQTWEDATNLEFNFTAYMNAGDYHFGRRGDGVSTQLDDFGNFELYVEFYP